MRYSYVDLLDDLSYMAHYGVTTGHYGASLFGRLLPYVHIGKKSGKQLLLTAGIHAREHVSSLMAMRIAYRLVEHEPKGGGVYILPMLNPDGNMLFCEGLSSAPAQSRELLQRLSGSDFSLYKANGRGVDLNVNFDARWGTGKSNIRYAAPENYIGASPFSEPETQAVRDFILAEKPDCTVSYHALGQEVYWDFFLTGELRQRNFFLGKLAADTLGYTLLEGDEGSAGGLKDYCLTQNIPSLTVELVSSAYSHPLSSTALRADTPKNLLLPQKILDFLNAE